MIGTGSSSSSRGQPSGPVSIVLGLVLVAAAVPALGRPELAAAGDFMTSQRPSRPGALAAVQLIVWVLVIALVAWQLMHALRRPGGRQHEMRRRRSRSRAALVIGILILCGGAVHRQASGTSICCGDLPRAERLLH